MDAHAARRRTYSVYAISQHAPRSPAVKPSHPVVEPSPIPTPGHLMKELLASIDGMMGLADTITKHDAAAAEGLLGGFRLMPDVTPQTVGVYFSSPLGSWDVPRYLLPRHMLLNASLLAGTANLRDRVQLHLELALHWHCLSSIEKFAVAHAVGPLADAAPSVREWLSHMVEQRLPEGMPLDFTASMPVDHMYDYGGFMAATGRVYGELPPAEAARHSVCVVGGGPAGIVAADGLNRLGVRVTVLEQAPEIGGRLMTVRLPPRHGDDDDGPPSGVPARGVSPTPMEMGGMRFAPFPGNSFYRLITQYGLHTEPFPNPGGPGVQTMFLIGNELFDDVVCDDGAGDSDDDDDNDDDDGGGPAASAKDPPSLTATSHSSVGLAPSRALGNLDLMRKVRADYLTAMRPLLDPIMKARAHADTARVVELCKAAFRRFDHNTFQGGLDDLLREQGIAWGTEEWDLFGGIGIGVGGYDGYYTTGFLEEFRFLVDRRLEEHVFLPGGANSVLHAIVDDSQLPAGRRSLRDQGAVRCTAEVERIIRTGAGYEVTYLDKASGARSTEVFSEVFFAAGPSEAIRLGLTSPQPGSLPLMPDELAKALRRANLVGATKLAVKVPIDAFDGLDIPSNIQSTQPFQQVYVLPPTPGATSRVIFLSYQLGDNAAKTTALSAEEQFNVFVRIIANVALSTGPGDAKHDKFRHFAELLRRGKDRMSFVSWGREKHFGGAFKMDRPLHAANTDTLWQSSMQSHDGAIFINEMMTAEGGFASGAVSIAINGVQQFVLRNGGTLPPHSPLHMRPVLPSREDDAGPRYPHRGSGSMVGEPGGAAARAKLAVLP